MGWQNNIVYTKWQQGVKLTNILPTHVETNNFEQHVEGELMFPGRVAVPGPLRTTVTRTNMM
jgi:hypothetical protein